MEEPTIGILSQDKSELLYYEIVLDGRLGEGWELWFDGFTLVPGEVDVTRLLGPVADQAALHGLLIRMRDLGIPLISVNRLEPVI